MADGIPPTAAPPMEEILASIRRIIADEPPIGSTEPEQSAAASQDDDVLELGAPLEEDAPVAPSPAAEADAPTLVSDTTQHASRQALAALSSLTIDPNADANTLDGMVRELLRPMLKNWLDANLPELVERLVAREIARIGGR